MLSLWQKAYSMERIKLSKAEKQVLRELHRGNNNIPIGMDNYTYVDAVLSLTEHKLAKSIVEYDTKVVDVKITAKGYAYMRDNPSLINPINWNIVTAIATTITSIITFLALFISCSIIASA